MCTGEECSPPKYARFLGWRHESKWAHNIWMWQGWAVWASINYITTMVVNLLCWERGGGGRNPIWKFIKKLILSKPVLVKMLSFITCVCLLFKDSNRKKVRKPRGPSRFGGWSEDGSRAGTPTKSNHSYNLRRRTNGNFDNPILDSESPNSFGKLVSQLSHITQVSFFHWASATIFQGEEGGGGNFVFQGR